MSRFVLYNPDVLELDDTYRSLAKHDSVYIQSANLSQALINMEKIGYIAMFTEFINDEKKEAQIKAFKGKHGPCIFNGHVVSYSGEALAALDDDRHLLVKGMPLEVCDKTYNVFNLPPYQGLVVLNKEKIQQNHLETNLDLDGWLSFLSEHFKAKPRIEAMRDVLFYPGPFKMLILQDGSIVYRGRWNNIPAEFTKSLLRKDGFKRYTSEELIEPVFFQDLYKLKGSMLLMEDLQPEPVFTEQPEVDFAALKVIGSRFRDRLLTLIDKEKKYLPLVGTDMSDKMGCCPSEDVTEANKLVRAGILSAFAEQIQGDSCPVTIYSFRGEMTLNEGRLESQIDQDFREEVKKALKPETRLHFRKVARWVLLAFVAVSLALGIRQCRKIDSKVTFPEAIELVIGKQTSGTVTLVLFHNHRRCYQCTRMENFVLDILETNFQNEISSESLQFITSAIDRPHGNVLAGELGIFSATLVAFYHSGAESRIEVLHEASEKYLDESDFKSWMVQKIKSLYFVNE